jgi:hypothetical protein
MAEAKKPNVLLIVADDVGWFDVGRYRLRQRRGLEVGLVAGSFKMRGYQTESV